MSLRMQADDFLIAYEILQRNSETNGLAALAPTIVNLSFALELYLKDMYCAIGEKPPKEHKIIKLFAGLPEPLQQKIFCHEAISQNPFHTRGNLLSPNYFSIKYIPYTRFCDKVEAISDAFVQWRYPYDQDTNALSYDSSFALALIEAVKSVSDEIGSQS